MLQKDFNFIGRAIDQLGESYISRYSDVLEFDSYINGNDLHYSDISLPTDVVSTIRDPVDDVHYFMIGYDFVGSGSKAGE